MSTLSKQTFRRWNWFWVVCLGMLWNAWAVAQSVLKPPQFLSQPRKVLLEGELLRERLSVWGEDWRVERVVFSIRKGPQGLQIANLGQRGCCRWWALLTWLPKQQDVGKHDIVIEAQDQQGRTVQQSFTLEVLNRNDPPVIRSSPPLQGKEDALYTYAVQAIDPDPTKDVLNYRLLSAPQGMSITDKGVISWRPTSAQVGKHEVSVEVRDQWGASARQSFVLQIENVEQPPQIVSQPLLGATVGQPYLYQLQVMDPDPGATVNYQLLTGPTGMTLSTTGLLLWEPKQEGQVQVSVEALDNTGRRATQGWTLVVVKQNQWPQIVSEPPITVEQGKSWTYQIQGKDEDQDTLSFVLVKAPTGMQLRTLSQKNMVELQWNPGASDVGVHAIEVRVDDQKGGVVWEKFRLRVLDVNDEPVIVSQPITTVLQNQPYRYQVQAKDADGDVLRYALQQSPVGMQIDATTGLVTWTPVSQSTVKVHNVEVVVSDNRGGITRQSYLLEVIDTNDLPQWTSQPPTGATQESQYTYLATVQDDDAAIGEIWFRLVEHPVGMQVDATTGLVRWTPGKFDVGQHRVVLEAMDARGGRIQQSFWVVVKNLNDAPVVMSQPVRAAQVGRLYRYEIVVEDPDPPGAGDNLTFSLSGPKGMVLEQRSTETLWRLGDQDLPGSPPSVGVMRATAVLLWTPTTEDAKQASVPVKVQISDGQGAVISHDFVIRVWESNNRLPQVKKPEQLDVEEGQAFQWKLEATDPDQDPLLMVLLEGPTGLVLDEKTQSLFWTPQSWQQGTWKVKVRVDDQKGGVVWWQTIVKVKPRNHFPQIISTPLPQAVVGQNYTYALQAVDPDDDDRTQMRWSLLQSPTAMTLDAQRGILSWNPDINDVGSHVIRVQVLDRPGGLTAEQNFVLEVKGSNFPPQITSTAPTATLKEGELFSHTITASDLNLQDVLTYRLLEAPVGMEIGTYTGLIQWIPTPAQIGKHTVRCEVSDDQGGSTQQTWTLQVEDINQAPVISSEPPTGATVGQLYQYVLGIQDPEGDGIQDVKLLVSPIALQPQHQMKVDPNTLTVSWVPGNEHRDGAFLVMLQVSDKRGAISTQHFVVRVFGSNRVPQWKQPPPTQTVKISENQSYQLMLQAEDADGDVLTYDVLEAPQGLVIQSRTGLLLWTPSSRQVGTHAIVVVVRDGRGGEIRASWQVEVQNRNDAPVIVSQPEIRASVGKRYEYQVRAVDPDPQDKLRYVLQQAPSGLVIDAQTGLMQWTPGIADAGQMVNVLVRVFDTQGASDSQLFQIAVSAENRNPRILSAATLQATEGQLFFYQVRAVDDDGDALRFALLRGPAGMVIGERDGWLRWVPANRDVGQNEISVQVTDSQGATGIQAFSIQVSNSNNAPRFLSVPCSQASVNTTYKCILVVEDIDPQPQQLFVEVMQGPSQLKAQISPGTSGTQPHSVYLVSLTWEPQSQDVGFHPIELRVSDGVGSDRMVYLLDVRSSEELPIAVPGEDQRVFPGEISLDGRKSRDAKGLSVGLTYQWRLVQGPQEDVRIDNPNRSEIRVILRRAGTYIFSLVVEKDGLRSTPGIVQVVVKNVAPSAHIWTPMAGEVGQDLVLDGRFSVDTNGDGLLYQWKLWIDDVEQKDWTSTASSLTWKPTQMGLHRFSLTVKEDKPEFQRPEESTFSVEVVVHDASHQRFLPHAVIVGKSEGNVGQGLILDGSRSRLLPEEQGTVPSSYAWTILSGPDGGKLTAPSALSTSFLAESPGYYRIGLVVKNQGQTSQQAVWGIAIQGANEMMQLPVARVVASYAFLESWFQMDASQSTGPGGDQLQFIWTQNNGAVTEIRDEKTARPSFFVLHTTPYWFQLLVQGRGPQSAPVSVQVLVNTKDNKPPIADAGPSWKDEKSRTAGQLVELDGSRSYDPDGVEGVPLVYRWKQVAGFPVYLQGFQTAKPSFVPFSYGIYEFSLEVFDGIAWSRPSTVSVVVHSEKNKVPHADAGTEQTVRLGQSVSLDGSKSYDLDAGDTLEYRWRLIEPSDRQVVLNLTDPLHPSFTAKDPTISRYVFGLVVDDGKASSLEATVSVRVNGINHSPVAQIKVSGQAIVGQELILDGSSSTDQDGDTLTYSWKQLSGSPLQLNSTESSELRIRATKEGTYRFQLQVNDGLAQSVPVSIVVQILPPEPEVRGCQCSQAGSVTPFPLWILVILGLWLFGFRRLRTLFVV